MTYAIKKALIRPHPLLWRGQERGLHLDANKKRSFDLTLSFGEGRGEVFTWMSLKKRSFDLTLSFGDPDSYREGRGLHLDANKKRSFDLTSPLERPGEATHWHRARCHFSTKFSGN